MALFKFIAALFKKIKKLFTRKGGDGPTDRLPGERRIGIYGPSNVGKSVFFTMLYKACRQDRIFNLSPDDPNTGRQLVEHLNTLRSGEWLPGTVEESELNFKASTSGGSQFPFSTRDYKGETVDLEQEGAAKEKLIEYFQSCDAILFLLSPEMIADARKCEREIMSFTAMINQVTEQGGRGLRIPIGLMITKADSIDGFENESQVTLISRKAEYLKAKDFGSFVEGVCGQYHVARNIVFQEQVRETMQRLSLFFDFLMTLSMEFQVFFVSSVGHVREVPGEDGGVDVRPPEDPDGIGVKTPFLWVIETIRRKEKIAAFNGFRRFVFRAAMVVLVFYSLFYGWHFFLSKRLPLREMVAEETPPGPDTVEETLSGHSGRWIVRNFGLFPLPSAAAREFPGKTRSLSASYQAHRYLNEELRVIDGKEELQALAEGYKTEAWKSQNPWYEELIGDDYRAVDEAVAEKIARHNFTVAKQIESHLRGLDATASREEMIAECERLRDRFVTPPEQTSEYQGLVDRAEQLCRRGELQTAEREMLFRWDQIVTRIREIKYAGADELADIRQAAKEFIASVGPNHSQLVQDSGQIAQDLNTYLNKMLFYSDDPEANKDVLSEIRRAGGTLKPIADWARQKQVSLSDAEAQAEAGELTALVQAELAKDTLRGLAVGPLANRIKNAKLRGAQKAALDEYKTNLQKLRDDGVRVTMKVEAAPPGFVVMHRDATGDWSGDQAAVGLAVNVVWKVGRPVEIGIRRSDGGSAICEADSRSIFSLHGADLNIACDGSQGRPTRVRFENIEGILRTQLAEPLGRAFP